MNYSAGLADSRGNNTARRIKNVGSNDDKTVDAVEEAGLGSFPASDAPASGRTADSPRIDDNVRALWASSYAGDFAAEHEIYDADTVLDYPSRENAFEATWPAHHSHHHLVHVKAESPQFEALRT